MRPVSLYSKDIENLNAYCVLKSGWYSILLFESKWYDFRAFPNWVSGILMFLYIAQRYGHPKSSLSTLWAHGHVFLLNHGSLVVHTGWICNDMHGILGIFQQDRRGYSIQQARIDVNFLKCVLSHKQCQKTFICCGWLQHVSNSTRQDQVGVRSSGLLLIWAGRRLLGVKCYRIAD